VWSIVGYRLLPDKWIRNPLTRPVVTSYWVAAEFICSIRRWWRRRVPADICTCQR